MSRHIFCGVFAVVVLLPRAVGAQFDRALDGPMDQIKRHYEDIARAGGNRDGETLYKLMPAFVDDTDAILQFHDVAVTALRDGGTLTVGFADRAVRFRDSVSTLRRRAQELLVKLGTRGEDFSSAYSSLRDAWSDYTTKAEEIRRSLYTLGPALKLAVSPEMFGKFERGMDTDEPMSTLKRLADQIASLGSDKKADEIFNMMEAVTKNINAVYTLVMKLPETLKVPDMVANVPERADRLNDAVLKLRERCQQLYDKVKVRGSDFSSELSNFKDAFSNYLTRGDELRAYIFPGVKAVRQACAQCLR